MPLINCFYSLTSLLAMKRVVTNLC